MLEIEDGVAAGRVGVVIGGRVDVSAAGGVGDFGLIPGDAHVAVGDVVGLIKVGAFFGDFNAAGLFGPAEIGFAAGIVDGHAIDEEPVIMKTGDGGRNRDGPRAVVAFGHVEGAFAQAALAAAGLELDFLSAGGAEA